ncbi:phage baseplate assembly protein V [Myxococcus stipitatus]|uniref:phage baseplate assembly protein V n=1 Tax=Myxococcus stipitatus TaxID=83455 RepID=UPI001F3E7DF1|nr:phage baseplate assembly protein V [Myxococcus stipitatus]MCE9672836.1 phage baseplate assembly protein V [Myxococcus stipitatus]
MDERVARYIERNEGRHWGKYRGIVEDRNDPEKLGRLKLRVPSLLGDAVTGWAWPSSPYAGAGVGFVFVPQVGDLVWVEFAEGDLELPLWTGCAWAKPKGTNELPPEAQNAYPDQAVIKTKSGHVIILSDVEGSERITIRATNGCEITLDPNAKRVTVQAEEIILRGGSGDAEELATKTFVTQVFDQHTHPTGVGPSGKPLPLSSVNPRSLTSIVKAE